MKMRSSSIILLLFLLVAFTYHNVLGENQLTEQQALNILMAQIQKDKLYDGWTTLSCLQFLTEEETAVGQWPRSAAHQPGSNGRECATHPTHWAL